MVKEKFLNWWRLDPNLTSPYEYLMLELSGAWKLVDSSRVQGFGLGLRSHNGVFSQNMAGRSKAR